MAKHIVIDAREFSSGSGRYIRKLLYYLERIDKVNNYTILLHSKDLSTYQPKASNFNAKAVPFQKFTIGEQFGFASYLKSLHPDLVHFTFANQPIFYRRPKVTAVLDLTACRFNLAFGFNRLFSPFRRRIYSAVVKSAINNSEQVITLSKFVKDDVLKTFKANPDKVTVAYNAADPITEAATPIENLKKTKFILYVGRAQAHKNISFLVDAFNLLRTSHPDLKLVLVGKKDIAYTNLEQYIEDTQTNGVVLTGYVSDSNLKWLYSHCEAYVFPSLSEGFGLPGLEAMVHGAPVISSNATCLPEIYGDAALYFNPTSVDDAVQKIERVLNDKDFRKELIARGHQQAAKYSWQRMAEQTLEVYERVLRKK